MTRGAGGRGFCRTRPAPRPISCASTCRLRHRRSTTRPSPQPRSSRRASRWSRCRPSPKTDPPRHLVRLCFGKQRRNHRCRGRGHGQGQGAVAHDVPPTKPRHCLATLGVDDGGDLVSHSPIDGQTIGRVATGDPATSRRVRAAQRRFLHWRTVPAPRRGELVRLLGEELRGSQGAARPAGDAGSRARSSRRASAKSRR